MNPQITAPAKMSDSETAEFIKFVAEAGEVDEGTLPDLVKKAAALITLHDGDKLIGTAAIKNPNCGYRADVFRKAGVEDPESNYPFELGWVVTHKDYRRRGHGRSLVKTALSVIEKKPVYATTISEAMKGLFAEFSFVKKGKCYRSKSDEMLSLFVRQGSA